MSYYCNPCDPCGTSCPTSCCNPCYPYYPCPTGCYYPCYNPCYSTCKTSCKKKCHKCRKYKCICKKKCHKCKKSSCTCKKDCYPRYTYCAKCGKCGFISVSLAVSASPTTYGVTGAGTVITYSYVLTNTGNVPIAGSVNICDSRLGTQYNRYSYILPGNTATYTNTYTVTAADVSGQTTLTNTATAYVPVADKCNSVVISQPASVSVTYS